MGKGVNVEEMRAWEREAADDAGVQRMKTQSLRGTSRSITGPASTRLPQRDELGPGGSRLGVGDLLLKGVVKQSVVVHFYTPRA